MMMAAAGEATPLLVAAPRRARWRVLAGVGLVAAAAVAVFGRAAAPTAPAVLSTVRDEDPLARCPLDADVYACAVDVAFPPLVASLAMRTFVHAQRPNASAAYYRTFRVFDGELQGPTRRVRLNEIVEVTLVNAMGDAGLSLHHHGVHMDGTPFNDGAAMLSGPPLPPGRSTTFRFRAFPAGTHYYHSHVAGQFADGLSGAFVVEDPADPAAAVDEVLMVKDFAGAYDSKHQLAAMESGLQYADPDDDPDARSGEPTAMGGDLYDVCVVNGLASGNALPGVPRQGHVFFATVGDVARLRLVDGSFEGRHAVEVRDPSGATVPFLVVAADGQATKPLAVARLATYAGERYDILLAPATPGDYSVVFAVVDTDADIALDAQPVGPFGGVSNSDGFPGSTRVAVPGARDDDATHIYVSPWGATYGTATMRVAASDAVAPDLLAGAPAVAVYDATARGALRSFSSTPPPKADVTIPFAITAAMPRPLEGDRRTRDPPPPPIPDDFPSAVSAFLVNGEAWIDPAVPLYLAEGHAGRPGAGQTEGAAPGFDGSAANVFDVPLGAVVDVAVVHNGGGQTPLFHPVHLHGHKFWVIGQGSLPYDAEAAADRYDLDAPVLRDTYPVRTGEYAVLRFVADNPGVWHLHCHLFVHFSIGLQAALVVGGPADRPAPPADYFTAANFDDAVCACGQTLEPSTLECPADPYACDAVVNLGEVTATAREVTLGDGNFRLARVFLVDGAMTGLNGPPRRVALDSVVELTLTNALPDEPVSLHHHGIHQRGTPFNDGASMISAAPLPPGRTQTIRFRAAPAGTHFYHSHFGSQYGDGLVGAFVVEDPDDPWRGAYDVDEVLVVTDWTVHEDAAKFISDKGSPAYMLDPDDPVRGSTNTYGGAEHEVSLVNGVAGASVIGADPAGYVFGALRGQTARVRIADACWNAKHVLTVLAPAPPGTPAAERDVANFTVIAADGMGVKPVRTAALYLHCGERFDLLLDAAREGDYTLVFETLDHGGITNQAAGPFGDEPGGSGKTSDVLEWRPNAETDDVAAVIFEDRSAPAGAGNGTATMRVAASHLALRAAPDAPWVPVVDASATGAMRSPLALDLDQNAPPPAVADAKLPVAITGAWLYMGDDAYRADVPVAFPSAINSFRFNGEAWVEPTVPLYVSRGAYGMQTGLGDFDASKLVFPVALGDVVDVVVINNGAGTVTEIHPMHLHGHKFWVVGQGALPYDDARAYASLDLEDAPLKDTLGVRTGTYAILRFVADNPGVWHFHCHLAAHYTIGAQAALVVGDFEDAPPPPRDWYTAVNYDDAICACAADGEDDDDADDDADEAAPPSAPLEAPLVVAAAAPPAAPPSPHVVISLVDDQGHADAPWSAVDGARDAMPFAAALAAEGVVLDQYRAALDCTPSRAMVLTGRHHAQLGLTNDELLPDGIPGIPLDEALLPELLKAADPTYRAVAVGKWDVGSSVAAYWPTRRGFDAFFGFVGPYIDYFTHRTMEYDYAVPLFDFVRDEVGTDDRAGQYSTFAFRDEAVEAARDASASRPLFLYVAWNAIHGDVQVPQNVSAAADALRAGAASVPRGLALAALRLVDDANRAIHAALPGAARARTIWVQASDNGGDTDAGGSNWPLRGGRGTPFDGGVRAPAFVWLGSDLRATALGATAGTRFDGLFHATDWAPTLLGCLARAPPAAAAPDKPLYGVDLSGAALRGDAAAPTRDEVLVIADYDPNATAGLAPPRGGARRLGSPSAYGAGPVVALVHGRWKAVVGFANCSTAAPGEAVVCGDDARDFLFDLADDPGETLNVLETGAAPRAVVDAMRDRLKYNWARYVAPKQAASGHSMEAALLAAATPAASGDLFVAPFLDAPPPPMPPPPAADAVAWFLPPPGSGSPNAT